MGGTRAGFAREQAEGVLPAESVKVSRVEVAKDAREGNSKFEQLLKANNELMGEMRHKNNLV